MRDFGAQLTDQLVLEFPILQGKTLCIPVSRTSKFFLPISSMQEILLLEGIQGWSIKWYLAIIQKKGSSSQIHVIFEVRMCCAQLRCRITYIEQ